MNKTVIDSEELEYYKGCARLLEELYRAGTWSRYSGLIVTDDLEFWDKVKSHTGWSISDV